MALKMLPLVTVLAGLLSVVTAQGDTLGLSNGFLNLTTANFELQLVKDAQILASLKAAGGSFDFLPLNYLPDRAGNGQYHWGDVTFRYRAVGAQSWINGDSSQARETVTSVSTSANTTTGNSTVLAAANLAATLPSNASALSITRRWLDVGGDLGLSFTLENTAKTSIELGSLGFPAEFNSIFTNYTAEETQEYCVLSDPYIGMDAGYIRVSPINGNGAALVVTSLDASTPLEAYRNLDEPYYDSTAYGSQVFEGLYEWQTLTAAWAENEWSAVEPWNPPSSEILAPGDTLTFGLKFSLASGGIETIDDEVQAQGVPYARGIPGFILPVDLPGQLLVNPGSAGAVANIIVDPADALNVTLASSATGLLYTVTPSSSAFGRARLTITYTSGQVQTVHYYLVQSGPDHIATLGNFLTTEQYYTNASDPFGRSPSVISYDYSVGAPVLQDMRVWIAGLSDEAGAGSFLAASMKQAAQPNADEVAKLEDFVEGVLFKTLQPPGNGSSYAVRKSIFYYGLANYSYSNAIDWTTWESWDEADAYATDRAYDYVHVAASYWALYRAGRAYDGLLTRQNWAWYLNQSYNTVMAAMAQDAQGNWLVGYSTDGLMGETVFGELLKDLLREGEDWATQAAALEAKMRARAALWSTMEDPFGSEMAWDSTGQEGVYYWSKYFGDAATAEKTLATVLGFQPTVAHWGWNGNARRYWDFLYGGKLERIERQIHHYGSGLNALVALSAFRSNPTNNTYLLRIGYAGMNGPLSNIRADGCASAAFHSWPDTLAWDAYSGDYGPNHSGLVLGTGTYLVWDDELDRLVAYGGIATTSDEDDDTVTVSPRDVARKKVFIGPLGLLIEIDAGVVESFAYSATNASLVVTLGQLDSENVPSANSTVMWLSREDGTDAGYTVVAEGANISTARLGWQIPLGNEGSVVVDVVPT